MYRKWIAAIMLLFLCLTGCEVAQGPDNSPSGESTASPYGWQQSPEGLCYLDDTGMPLTGWQEIDGARYRFSSQGILITGWLNEAEGRYYLDDSGKMLTGIQEIGGRRYCFRQNGTMVTGWHRQETDTYFFGMDGAMVTGFLDIEGKVYYFRSDGRMHTGWLELGENRYYLNDQGAMAVGPTEIDGQTCYFNAKGIHILLVNPWNPLPEGYDPELVNVTEQDRIAAACSEALLQMLEDCTAAGYEPTIVSAYRTQEDQEFLFERKVKFYMDAEWPREDAERLAATSVAVPGTSEHQLGLAVDIIGSEYPYLDDYQANTPSQQWLMAHCHEYGFILRYPEGTTDITGIIYEPWHYRYVGTQIAREITDLGITLEEYLGATH